MFNYVRSERKKYGFDQKELSHLIGKSSNARVSRLEGGHTKPDFREVVVLELLFDQHISQIFPELYRRETNDLLMRLNDCELHIEDHLVDQRAAQKLDRVRKVRRDIAAQNTETK